MNWQGDIVVCAVAKHGESGVILRGLSEAHGLHAGYVHGGAGRKLRALLEPGNSLHAEWRARISEQLGNFTLEPATLRAADVMASPDRLAALASVCAVTGAALPERLPMPGVYHALSAVLELICDEDRPVTTWAAAMVRYELGLLAALGFGLDLARCAATGAREDLVYVSPRSARAVSRAAGSPYHDRLLPLPGYLLGAQGGPVTAQTLTQGMRLTGYFLEHHIFAPKGLAEPAARQRLAERLARKNIPDSD